MSSQTTPWTHRPTGDGHRRVAKRRGAEQQRVLAEVPLFGRHCGQAQRDHPHLHGRRLLYEAIRRIEGSARPDTNEIDEAMLRLRKVLLDYRAALRRVDPQLQVSVLDALKRELAITVMPRTDARSRK